MKHPNTMPGGAPSLKREPLRSPDDPEYQEPEEDDCGSDREELKRTTHDLGITRSYVQDWTLRDAFRELYQNW